MRLVVMSDIHGNLEALDSVVGSLPEHDRVIVAGDHCLEGPKPAQVVDTLRELGWEAVRGNTDEEISTPPDGAKPKKREIAEWARSQLGSERIRWLADLDRKSVV